MSLDTRYNRLLQVEVGSIQQFIFDGARLRDWRGASAVLDRIERRDLPDTLAEFPVEIVRSGGGVVVLGAETDLTDQEVRQLFQDVAATYRQKAPGARIYTSHTPPLENLGDASTAADLLRYLSFAAARHRGQSPASDPGTELLDPMVRFCDSCGDRPAERHRRLGDEAELVCTVCHAKGENGVRVRLGKAPESLIGRFGAFLAQRNGAVTDDESEEREPDDEEDGGPAGDGMPPVAWERHPEVSHLVPDDLTAIAEADVSGDIALIVADGNRLGQTVQSIDDLDTYQAFSTGVDQVVTQSVFTALARCAPPRTPSDGDEARLPWEIIFLGGDDVLLATTSDLAVPVTQAITSEIERRSRELFRDLSLEREFLSMAAGIAIGDPSTPIGVLRSLAGELEESAKNRTYEAAEKDREVSTVDFHRITAQGTTTLRAIRDRELRPHRHLRDLGARLTMRPFTMAELQEVNQLAKRWQEAKLPTSKVHDLRERLFESPAEATRAWTHVVGRASDDEKRRAWLDLMRLGPAEEAAGELTNGRDVQVRAPWIVDGNAKTRKTYLLDVIDLMRLTGTEG